LHPALSGIAKGEQRRITLSVNDLIIACRTSYSPSVANETRAIADARYISEKS